jgi:hypothetical protein
MPNQSYYGDKYFNWTTKYGSSKSDEELKKRYDEINNPKKPTEGELLNQEGVGEDGGFIDEGTLDSEGNVQAISIKDIDELTVKQNQQRDAKLYGEFDRLVEAARKAKGREKKALLQRAGRIREQIETGEDPLTIGQVGQTGMSIAKAVLPDHTSFADMSEFGVELWQDARAFTKGAAVGAALDGPLPFGEIIGGVGAVAVRRGGKELIELGLKRLDNVRRTIFHQDGGLMFATANGAKLDGGKKGFVSNVLESRSTTGTGVGGGIKQTELKFEPFQSNRYQRSVLNKMNKYGMGDGTFRMKAYKSYLNKGDSGRDMLEAYLSPDRLRGSFEGYKKFNKGSWEYKWGDFLKKKGYDLKQGIQAHHINPLFDSIHLFDNVKFNSKEYWSLMDTLVKNNARTGVIQKGDDINNLMMTLGQATDEATPHGIAHKFYNNFTPTFFSKEEMLKINNKVDYPGYRKKKAKRWATLVNKSEEIILEAHKQWSALNPKINMSFDELIEQMSNYNNLGYNKLIDPKYQLPDIHNIVNEIVTTAPKRGRKTDYLKKIEKLGKDQGIHFDPKTGKGTLQGDLFDTNE